MCSVLSLAPPLQSVQRRMVPRRFTVVVLAVCVLFAFSVFVRVLHEFPSIHEFPSNSGTSSSCPFDTFCLFRFCVAVLPLCFSGRFALVAGGDTIRKCAGCSGFQCPEGHQIKYKIIVKQTIYIYIYIYIQSKSINAY